jgi:hypothetical protein
MGHLRIVMSAEKTNIKLRPNVVDGKGLLVIAMACRNVA